MHNDGTGARDRSERITARSRARRYGHTDAGVAAERNADFARRLIESEELLSSAELERAKTQLAIAREHTNDDNWNKAELARYKADNLTRIVRSRLMLMYLAILCTWAVITLISGSAPGVTPTEIWHFLTSAQ
jgi:hypothetical protein